MMRFQAGPALAMLAPLFLVAACSGEPSSPHMLTSRMQARLSPEVESGQVAVQPLPAGTQVAISEQSLFAPGSAVLDDKGRNVLTYVVQALLEPSILSIQVADSSDSLQGARAAAVMQYFQDHQIGAQFVPTPMQDATQAVPVGAVGTPVQGLTITVSVVAG
jgi:hypothetical protein